MENNELFQTIEQLKSTLSDVSSAREQVTETVQAYSQTQKEIHSYVTNLEQIEKSITSIISLLQNNKVVIDQQSKNAVNNLKTSCDTVISYAKNEFSSTAQSFADDTNRNVASMASQIERFDRTIEKANTLTNKVETTSKEVSSLIGSVKALQEDLVSSQKSQDEAIGNISTKQDQTNTSLSELISKQNHVVEELGKSISENSNSIKEKLSSVITATSNSLINAIEDLKVSQEKNSIQIAKGINVNRWIIIAGFILIAILQYLFK